MGKQWKQWQTLFSLTPKSLHGDCSHEIKRYLLLGRKAVTNLDSILKIRDITLPTKICLVKATVFPVVMYVWTWELGHKEGWAPKDLCFWRIVLEKTLKMPLNYKKSKPVNSKGNQPWIFIEGTDAETEAPILWPSDVKSLLFGKDPDAGKDWRREEKGTTEDEMVGWHHQLHKYEFEQVLGDGAGQGSLACCSPWGRKDWDTTEWLNNNKFYSLSKCYYSLACLPKAGDY